MTMKNEFRIFGPPGCGKTTMLKKLITERCAQFGSGGILVASYTKAAAYVLVEKNLPLDHSQIGTLHSHGYRLLGAPPFVLGKNLREEFNRLNVGYEVGPSSIDADDPYDDNPEEGEGDYPGNEDLSTYDRNRARLLPRDLWNTSTLDFAQRWEEFKGMSGSIDFTDMIELCLDVDAVPFNAQIGFFDEVQDFSALELLLVRKWASKMEAYYLAGDDDQASLPGTQILVQGGDTVSVEHLDPSIHKLASYDFRGSELNGLRHGHTFKIASTPYNGIAHTVKTEKNKTTTTHNHPWIARWTEDAKNIHVVYLMQKGHSFRVGWCKLIRSDGCCHLTVRSHLEIADATWILKVCGSRSEASLYESFVAAHYGISTVIWRPIHDQADGYYTKESIQRLFAMLGDTRSRAARCLQDFEKDIEYPLFRCGKYKKFGSKSFPVHACNLEPDIMAIPACHAVTRNGVAWSAIQAIEKEVYDGLVYGLSVPPHHTYVADWLVTHNCLYQFRGSTSDAFLNPPLPPEQKIILGQSYRLPRAIHARAMEWVKDITPREDKPYKPTNQEGEIEDCPYSFKEAQALMGLIQDEIDEGKSVMVIAACGYMLLPLISELRRNGVAFHNPYKPKKGQWNPIRFSHKTLTSARRLFNFILPHPEHAEQEKAWWTYETFFSWAECLKGTTVIAPKMKTKIRDMAKEHPHAPLAMDDLKRWIPDQEHQDSIERGDLGWLQTHITDSWEKKLSYPFLIAENEGFQSLITTPSLVIGTIHSVKGAESDCVYLCPDLSMSGWESLHDGDEGEMAVRRQFYVGLTRARERLVLCRPTSERSLAL